MGVDCWWRAVGGVGAARVGGRLAGAAGAGPAHRAHAAGLNMVITHEPTFWSDADLIPPVAGNPLAVVLDADVLETDQMQAIADLTKGKVFDGRSGDLSDVFREIRGYQ